MFYQKRLPRYTRLPAVLTCWSSSRSAAAHEPDPALVRELTRLTFSSAHIYADTCSLLHKDGMKLLEAADHIFSSLPDQQLLILSSVVFELRNVAKKNPSEANRCTMILDKLKRMRLNHSVRIVESSSPEFSDAGFIALFVTETQNCPVVLITQDRKLADKTAHLPSYLDGCVNSTHPIRVLRLTADGDLSPFCQNQRKEEYYEKCNSKPVFLRADKARIPSFRHADGWYPAVHRTGGAYPRFYTEADARERAGCPRSEASDDPA